MTKVLDHIKSTGLPDSVKSVLKSLKKAANYLSISFSVGNDWLLFLGDAENYNIKRILNSLIKNGQSKFEILITPHHGTHWYKILSFFKFHIAISSLGSKLIRNYKTEYNNISNISLVTWINENLKISFEGKNKRVVSRL